jgi:hypothetical protein
MTDKQLPNSFFPCTGHSSAGGVVNLGTVAALLLAGASVLATVVHTGSIEIAVRQGLLLAVFVAVIAYPEVAEAVYRHTRRGSVRGGDGPTPAGMIRVVGWICLIALAVAHYATAIPGGFPWAVPS